MALDMLSQLHLVYSWHVPLKQALHYAFSARSLTELCVSKYHVKRGKRSCLQQRNYDAMDHIRVCIYAIRPAIT